MTSERKLQRYRDKDYSEVVQFPVELVDRDGVVRQYSYEESMRVYLRRIASAPWRYADDTVITAEVDHCNKRIDQLRRSYLLRCKHIGSQLAADQHTSDQCVLGEGLSLLHEHLGDEDQGGIPEADLDRSADLEIVALDEEASPAVYQVSRGRNPGLWLLYVYPREDEGSEESYQDHKRVLEMAATAAGASGERLRVARRGEVAFFLLTERMSVMDGEPRSDDLVAGSALDDLLEIRPVRSALSSAGDEPRPAERAFAAGLAALRRREPADAVAELKCAIDLNPYHREAYLALSTLLDMMGEVDEGGMYAAMAVAYHPEDGLIRFNQGLNLLRQGKRGEALVAFDNAAELDGGLYQPYYFAGLIHAIEHRLGPAAEALERACELTFAERSRVEAALAWVRSRQRSRRRFLAGAGAAAVVAAVTAWWWPLIALGATGLGLLLMLGYPIQVRRARRRMARSTARALRPGAGD